MKTVIEMAHRTCWRYKKSTDPHHSDTYTFNDHTLEAFSALVREDDAERIAILEQDNANCRKAVSDLMDKLNERENQQEPVAMLEVFSGWEDRYEVKVFGSGAAKLLPDGEYKLYTTQPTAALAAPDVADMVNQFLGWKLPKEFAPDGGISFDREYGEKWGMPVGTHLFTADQARQMFEYCLAGTPTAAIAALPVPDNFSDATKKIDPPKLRRAGSFGE